MNRFLRRVSLALFLILTPALLGCGNDRPKTASVKGKVTYQGQPVPNGTITFMPDGPGSSASGELQKDGSYTLTTFRQGDGAIPGPYKVVIIAMQDNANRLPEERNPLPPSIVPDKYTSAATSDLSAVVKDGENICDFQLVDPKRR